MTKMDECPTQIETNAPMQARGKRSKRPPSLTAGLYVPLVKESHVPIDQNQDDKASSGTPSGRHSCPAVLEKPPASETTVCYFLREKTQHSQSFRKATGVLKNGEIVFMGETFNSTKEFVAKIKALDWAADDQKIATPTGKGSQQFGVSPRSGAMMDAMMASLHNAEDATPPPSTPRQPASWPAP
eukprot:CAMPEP_0202810126 /NCGR_PEP_ID=MMETSP1389-20130828/2314_1 /ASSEMBLY_ACC=CAM_ASM_000865 /TAXON_ID=302021 /ORGANISM="Rhodomonas sp., Strain CCMP768" /LENGTH=184 /DNA_ID=CAMNT_0049480937 /DNA_START=51 /DNA_END=605 /DNA_ORIENTATION=+